MPLEFFIVFIGGYAITRYMIKSFLVPWLAWGDDFVRQSDIEKGKRK